MVNSELCPVADLLAMASEPHAAVTEYVAQHGAAGVKAMLTELRVAQPLHDLYTKLHEIG